jgi:hypothetical protein
MMAGFDVSVTSAYLWPEVSTVYRSVPQHRNYTRRVVLTTVQGNHETASSLASWSRYESIPSFDTSITRIPSSTDHPGNDITAIRVFLAPYARGVDARTSANARVR